MQYLLLFEGYLGKKEINAWTFLNSYIFSWNNLICNSNNKKSVLYEPYTNVTTISLNTAINFIKPKLTI